MINSDPISTRHLNEHNSSPSAGLVARLLARSITTYQRLTSGRPSPCRFYPSCSNYALEAITIHGALRGTGLALRRLGRCRPLGPHGVDLVPEPRPKTRSSK
ncbi:MAG: membrane protein insertion efficiency factor YidD [Acidimicrobiales bacterium]